MMYVSQIIMLYTLNWYSAVCLLPLNKIRIINQLINVLQVKKKMVKTLFCDF